MSNQAIEIHTMYGIYFGFIIIFMLNAIQYIKHIFVI